jgi:hypothetical protein
VSIQSTATLTREPAEVKSSMLADSHDDVCAECCFRMCVCVCVWFCVCALDYRELLLNNKALSKAQVYQLVEDFLTVLSELHAKNKVHLDLKLENLLVDFMNSLRVRVTCCMQHANALIRAICIR